MKKKPLKIYLDDDMLDWLRKEADERRCSMAQIVRFAIMAMIPMKYAKEPHG